MKTLEERMKDNNLVKNVSMSLEDRLAKLKPTLPVTNTYKTPDFTLPIGNDFNTKSLSEIRESSRATTPTPVESPVKTRKPFAFEQGEDIIPRQQPTSSYRNPVTALANMEASRQSTGRTLGTDIKEQGLSLYESAKTSPNALVSGMATSNIGNLNTLRTILQAPNVAGAKLQGLVTGKEVTPREGFIVKGLEDVIKREESVQQAQQAKLPQTGIGKYTSGAISSAPQLATALAGGSANVVKGAIGASAFGSGAREAELQGKSFGQQVTAGVGRGLTEIVTESKAIDNLVGIIDGKATVKGMFKQALAESLGEASAEALSPIVEASYNRGAFTQAYGEDLGQTIKQIAEAGFTGALMGIMVSGATMGVQGVQTAISNPTAENIEVVRQGVEAKTGVDLNMQQGLQQAKLPQTGLNIEQRLNLTKATDTSDVLPNVDDVPQQTTTEQAFDIENKAKEAFGTTEDIVEGGFLLSDGSMLDFSGKRDGGESGVRYMDHREIDEIYEGSSSSEQQTDTLLKFMEDTGAVRISVTEDGADINIHGDKPLTVQQRRSIKRAIVNKENVNIEYDPTGKASPTIVKSASFPTGLQSATLVNDIVSEIESQQIVQDTVQPTVQPTQAKVEPTTMDAKVGEDGMSMTMTLDELAKANEPKEVKVATGEPIDTTTRVLTELPKKILPNLADKAERVYQEIVSKNIPLENIGGKTEVQGSNLNRLQGTVEYNIAGKQTKIDGTEVGKSIVDIYEDVDANNKKDLFDYVLNKHNIDRWKQDKPVFGETIDDTISANKVAEYEQANPEFIEKQKDITTYFKNLMDEWSVKSGIVSKETADMLSKRYPNYVPTYRAKDFPRNMLSGNNNVNQIIKKAKGGEDFILPIDQQMIAMTSRTIKNAKRNELMNTLAEAYESGDPKAERYITKITNTEKESVNDFFDVGSRFDTDPVVKGNEYAVNFYTDGVPRQMVVNKTLFKALEQSQSDDGINKVARMVKRYATNPFKSLITGYNPIFGASNIMRDVPTALTYSDNPIEMSKNVPEAVKQILTNGDKYKMFKAMGGTREGLIGEGKTFKVPNLNETKKAYKIAQKANPIKTIGDVNGFTETLPRFSEFMAVLEKTGDPALAIYKSAELTTDFSRHGNLTKLIDSFVPYLNPSVQGIDKFARSAVKSPIKTALKGAAFITLPSMLLDFINSDDDDYNELSPRERNLYFNIPFEWKGEKKFLRVPKSRELGVAFSSIYEWAARAARGQEVTGEEIAQTIAENFTPADINSPIWTPALKAWKQIKNPEAYETNYWGGLIVPTTQRKYSPGEQYDLNSSGIAKAIGKQFNLSPFVVDYLIKSYTGIIGQVVQPIGADRKFSKLAPLENKFITDPVYKSDSINKFYEKMAEAKKEAQDFNKLNDIPSKTVTPLEDKANALNKIAIELSSIRKEQKVLQVQKDKKEEIKTLQEVMNEMARKAIE